MYRLIVGVEISTTSKRKTPRPGGEIVRGLLKALVNDLDYYSLTYNCLTFDLGKALKSGFTLPHGFIRKPKSIMAASALSAVLFQSVQNQQYGGVAVDRFDEALAPWAEGASDREVEQAMEAFVFNLNTLHSRAGNQVVFSSVTGGLGTDANSRRIWKAFMRTYDRGLGKGEQPMFPNIVFKIKEGLNWLPTDPNYDLLMESLEVSSRRMNPTYLFLDASFNKPYGLEVSAMGCRTRVIANRHGEEKITGRGNIAFVGINLPRIAIEAEGDVKRFYRLLKRKLVLCEAQLIHRYNILKKLYVKDIPFIFGQGMYMGADGLKDLDHIEPALKNGTLSIGWIGLAETLVALTGKHHAESDESQKLGLEIIKYMREFTNTASNTHDLNFSLIASPAEGLAGRFIALDKRLYGEIPGVTDKEYYTNSFHVPVGFEIDANKKIDLEAPYHALTNAGHISYVELGEAPTNNPEGLYKMLEYMKAKDMGYIGFNYPIDYCTKCTKQGYFPDTCTYCNSTDIKRIRRITGYFSTEERFNAGKLAELNDRVLHANKEVKPNG